MARVLRGDERAFSLLVARYERPLFALFARLLDDRQWAEDLCQDTFLRIYQRAEEYDPTRPFSTWLYTIATRLGIDALRRRKKAAALFTSLDDQSRGKEGGQPLGETLSGSERDPGIELEKKEAEMRVRKALATIPPEARLVLILRHYQELSYQEISTVLDCPMGTVKSRLHYAVHSLRAALQKL
jgi:RNA polymerase sigma-70 factor (ECF subfamily)